VFDRRAAAWVATVGFLAVVSFVVFRSVGVGSSAAPKPVATTAPTATSNTFTPLAEYSERTPHVDSQLFLIDVAGVVRGGPSAPLPDLPAIPARDFKRPVAEYIGYAERQVSLLEGDVGSLEQALASGDRTTSERAWLTAFSRYLRLGAVYLEGPLATLNEAIDGSPGGVSGGTSSPQFVGLHRIEFGLWTGASPSSLEQYAVGLAGSVRDLARVLPHVTISPLDYATRAHEILEDAVRDLLSGTEVPWSGAGVLGTQAGLIATREVLATLGPLLHDPPGMVADPPPNPRSPAIVDADLDELQSVLNSLAQAHGGVLPSNGELTQTQREELDASIGQALEGLAQVPGMLETKLPPAIPAIPSAGVKIDP
jgi:high-affinity iron transporter